METALPFLIAIAFIFSLIRFFRFSSDRAHVAKLDTDATDAFKSFIVDSIDPRYSLSGLTAKITKREVVGGLRGILEKTADLSVTIYARNEHGEDFLWKWFSKSPKPYCKHLPKSRSQTSK